MKKAFFAMFGPFDYRYLLQIFSDYIMLFTMNADEVSIYCKHVKHLCKVIIDYSNERAY